MIVVIYIVFMVISVSDCFTINVDFWGKLDVF